MEHDQPADDHRDELPSEAQAPVPADPAAAYALIDVLLDGRSTAEDRRKLQAWVVGNPDIADLYARAVHLWCTLPDLVQRPEHPVLLLADDPKDETDVRASLSETMILPALREVDLAIAEGSDELDKFPPAPVPLSPPVQHGGPRWWLVAAAVAAVAVIVPAVWLTMSHTGPPIAQRVHYPSTDAAPDAGRAHEPLWTTAPALPLRPPAMVSAVAAAVLRGSATPLPGTRLTRGQRFDLASGGMEITFDSGAVVVVSAPAQVRVADTNLLALDSGTVTAHVPPAAIGFRVDSPGLSVVDRGTDFGVRTNPGGTGSEVSVFKGAVDASASASAADQGAVRVTAGHAASHQTGDQSWPHETAYVPSTFVRAIDTVLAPIPLHGTGAGLSDGTADPAWQIVDGPGGDRWKAQPAYALVIDPSQFNANTPASRWVSTAPQMQAMSEGHYSFRTTVDLTGFNPETAVIRAEFVADNRVDDIRVNGTSTQPFNPLIPGRTPMSPPRSWTFPSKLWHKGANQVDVVVMNKATPSRKGKVVGLQLSWKASACPIVVR